MLGEGWVGILSILCGLAEQGAIQGERWPHTIVLCRAEGGHPPLSCCHLATLRISTPSLHVARSLCQSQALPSSNLAGPCRSLPSSNLADPCPDPHSRARHCPLLPVRVRAFPSYHVRSRHCIPIAPKTHPALHTLQSHLPQREHCAPLSPQVPSSSR